MKHFFKYIIIAVLTVIVSFIIFQFTEKYKINLLSEEIEWSIYEKGVNNAVDFEKSHDCTYAAYKNSIRKIKNEGTETTLFKDESLNIEQILLYNTKLYFLSDDKLYEYDIKKDKLQIILEEIPHKGEYMDRRIIINHNNLLLSIGSATNSGIAEIGESNNLEDIPYEKSPINIILNGNNYGENKTGAYMAYGNSSLKGQKIKAEKFGNSSIIEVNLKDKKSSLYACGIRNITGWDTDSEGNLLCLVGGAENKGCRPINKDSDYLYKIDKGKWYGWPDYSGGDPIDSPRFRSDKTVARIIKNPPNNIVSAPLYVFQKVNSVKYLAIDKEGDILEKNSLIYYDCSKNMICSLNFNGVMKELLKLKNNSEIENIKIRDGSAYILDSSTGCIYRMQGYNDKIIFNMPIEVAIALMIIMIAVVITFICKSNKKSKKQII